MEATIFESPCSPAAQSPENLFNTTRHGFLSAENHPQNPLITNLDTSSQAIESAFSRLTLSPDSRFRSQPLPFLGCPSALNAFASAETVPLTFGENPLAFGENQETLFWAQAQSSNASANGPFGPPGAHRNINVGPESMGFSGRGPYLDAGDHNILMKNHQRQDFYDFDSENYGVSILHGKEPFPRNAMHNFPVLPFAQQSNFGSSGPSLCSSQQLYKWLQELTPEIMRGRILSLANDQMCSSVLNLKVEEGLSEEEIEIVLPEVMEFSGELMRNQYGSNFVQKLFAACSEDQRTRIIMALTKYPFKFITLCLNSYGARAIQKLLEKLITPQQVSLVVSSLSPGAFALATDPNGQHVVHYCVKYFPGEYTKHLLNGIADNCFKIATNKSGCCVLQSCVENSRGEARRRLISEIIANAVHLAEDPYGNYVVQHLLGMKMPEATADLLRRFQGCFLSLSCNKYASNVVEKFLLESGENHSTTIIMELLESPNVSSLLLDPFGNFVIQSALSASKGPIHNALLNLIRVNAPSMQSNLYGKKILAWFEKRKALQYKDVHTSKMI